MNYSPESTATAPADLGRGETAPASPGAQVADVLLRFTYKGSNMRFEGALPTDDAFGVVRGLSRANRVLADSVVNLGRYMEFIGHHISFVSGQMDEVEFQEVSRGFSIVPTGDIPELAERIAIVLRETGVDFPPEQLEEICSAPSAEVDAALQLLADSGYLTIHQ